MDLRTSMVKIRTQLPEVITLVLYLLLQLLHEQEEGLVGHGGDKDWERKT